MTRAGRQEHAAAGESNPDAETPSLAGAYAYLAPVGYEQQLIDELGGASTLKGRWGQLCLAPARRALPVWSANVWLTPRWLRVRSITDAARRLRAIQRNWVLYPWRWHRRARLIQHALPHVSAKPLAFPSALPNAPLGSWTLVERNTILASPQCSSPFPNGVVRFVEDPEGPPNRAYLKLWEALTHMQKWPRAGERCLDLGASPGGWSWVCAALGAHVIAVDKAPLDAAVTALPDVEPVRRSAFSVAPSELGPVDWLLSDVVCYPERLLRLVHRWLEAGMARNIVCTLKFQGPTDHQIGARFAALGGRLLHLHHNKHELTWVYSAADSHLANK